MDFRYWVDFGLFFRTMPELASAPARPRAYVNAMVILQRSPGKGGAIERRSACPVRQDDTQKSKRAHRACQSHLSPATRGLELFPSGDRLLAWGLDAWATQWNATSGDVVCTLQGHTHSLSGASIFRGGDRVITGGYDQATGVSVTHLSCFIRVQGS